MWTWLSWSPWRKRYTYQILNLYPSTYIRLSLISFLIKNWMHLNSTWYTGRSRNAKNETEITPRECCERNKVPGMCVGLCMPKSPSARKGLENIGTCQKHWQSIMKCTGHKSGNFHYFTCCTASQFPLQLNENSYQQNS